MRKSEECNNNNADFQRKEAKWRFNAKLIAIKMHMVKTLLLIIEKNKYFFL